MHTPQGFEMVDGVAFGHQLVGDRLQPSMPYRFAHMMLGELPDGGPSPRRRGVSAFRWLIGDRARELPVDAEKDRASPPALGRAPDPAADLPGDLHGSTRRNTSPKVAAMEGLWETAPTCRFLLFALPDEETRLNDLEIGIPGPPRSS